MNLEILKVIYKLITFSWDKRTFLYHSQLVIKREIGIILLASNGLEKTSQLFCVISLFMQSQTDAVMLRSGGGDAICCRIPSHCFLFCLSVVIYGIGSMFVLIVTAAE